MRFLNAVALAMVLLLLVNVQFHEALRASELHYIKEGNLFLQYLQKGDRPPGNGGGYTPNGGGPPCINHKNFAGQVAARQNACPPPVF
ncbi:hypothetical protein BT93_J0631 [Corymbia citriodora subsp. variegata]|nr:hypothetical protein BT93_J0631 [Corymbia citriodora subsp. variegata]